MSVRPNSAWKPVTIVLAVLLVILLIFVGLVVADITRLASSLL
jgi:hypothetical protein